MKKIHLLMTAAVLAIALSPPALAATLEPRVDTSQASGLDQVRRDYYDTYGNPGYNAYARGQAEFDGQRQGGFEQTTPSEYPLYPSGNLPYPDRPYGAPDRD